MVRVHKYTLVSYDIVKDNKRNKIVEELKYWGLKRFQYSVFMGYLSKKHFDNLVETLHNFDLSEKDKIYVFTLCKRCYNQSVFIGKEPILDKQEHLIL